jgi:hypothetical protein
MDPDMFCYGPAQIFLLQIELPKNELVLAGRDDTSMYDDLHTQQDFKDDSRYFIR